jgi:hypothetical protein
VLAMSDGGDDTKDKLVSNWLHGLLLIADQFGDPVNGISGYRLCIYDTTAGTPSLVLGASAPAGGACKNGLPCWKPAGGETPTGYTYTDADRTPDGLLKVILRAGAEGKSKVIVKGKGVNLHMPPPISGSTYRNQQPEVWVQVVKTDDSFCFESRFPQPAVKNHVDSFKDVIP